MEDSLAYAEAVAIEGDIIIFVGDKYKAMKFKDNVPGKILAKSDQRLPRCRDFCFQNWTKIWP